MANQLVISNAPDTLRAKVAADAERRAISLSDVLKEIVMQHYGLLRTQPNGKRKRP